MSALKHRAEKRRLSTVLHRPESELEFCDRMSAEDLRVIRVALHDAAKAAAKDKLSRIAASSKIIPMGVAASVAEASLSPRLCAKMSSVLEPDHAAKMIEKVSPDFVRRIGEFADPDETAPMLEHVPAATVTQVSEAMAESGAWETIGCLLHIVDDETAKISLGTATEASQVLTAFLMLEEPEQIGRFLALCPQFSADDLRAAAPGLDAVEETDELLDHA